MMDDTQVQTLLIRVLRCALTDGNEDGTIAELSNPDVFYAVYALAKKHSLAHIVTWYVAKNKGKLDPQLMAKLQRDEILSVFRHERMKHAYQEICSTFEAAQIPYIPLKGSVLRQYYPDESMRRSCDIDILIREEDIPNAVEALKQKGYSCGDRHYHDVSLYSPNKIHLELHFSIQENMDRLDRVLKDAWGYAKPAEGYRYEFEKTFFVFHIYAHMAYHFLGGGCGIRSFMDIWVMEHKMDMHYSCAKTLLKKAGILQFAARMSQMANQVFSDGGENPCSGLVWQYVLSGGVYGSMGNKLVVEKRQIGNPVAYAWRRLFLPYESMVISYPILKKIPVLLPFCWIARWIKAVLKGKTKSFRSEVSYMNNISEEQLSVIEEICLQLGL